MTLVLGAVTQAGESGSAFLNIFQEGGWLLFTGQRFLATGREPRPSGLANKHPWASLQPPLLSVATLPHTFDKGGGSAALSPVLVSSGCYNKNITD